MVIKPDEFRTLVDYYKGNITESSLLNRAARVAAEARLLIEDPNIDPALKEPRVKQLIRERGQLVKELRQGAVPSSTTPAPLQNDEDRNIDSLQERMLKGLAQSINRRTDQLEKDLDTTIGQRAAQADDNFKQLQSTILKAPTKRKAKPKKKLTQVKKTLFSPPTEDLDSEDSWEGFTKDDKDYDPDEDTDSYDDSALHDDDDD